MRRVTIRAAAIGLYLFTRGDRFLTTEIIPPLASIFEGLSTLHQGQLLTSTINPRQKQQGSSDHPKHTSPPPYPRRFCSICGTLPKDTEHRQRLKSQRVRSKASCMCCCTLSAERPIGTRKLSWIGSATIPSFSAANAILIINSASMA